MRIFTLLVLLPLPALAEPAPPYFAPGLVDGQAGVACLEPPAQLDPAPGTALGYVSLGQYRQITWPHQVLPARIGLGFRVVVTSNRDIAAARVTVTRPGGSKPDSFFTTLAAGVPDGSGFGFEFPEEQVPGLWIIEAHDGETLLYRAEFEVLPPDALPELSCEGPSVS